MSSPTFPATNEWDILSDQFDAFEGEIDIRKIRIIARLAYLNYAEKLSCGHLIKKKLDFLLAVNKMEQKNNVNKAIGQNIFNHPKQSRLFEWLQRFRKNPVIVNPEPVLQE